MIETVREQLRSGDLTGAAQTCRKLLESAPADHEALHLLGLATSALGQHSQALGYLRDSIALEPRSGLRHYNLAVVLAASQRWHESYENYQQALDLGWNEVSCKAGLALAALESGNSALARDLCSELDQQGKASDSVLHCLARAHVAVGSFNEADSTWKRILQTSPGYAAVHEGLADLYRRLHKHTLFARHAELAVSLKPSARNMAQLGSAYWFCGRLEESLGIYEQALKRDDATADIRSAYLFALLHADSIPPERILTAHRQWCDAEGTADAPAIPGPRSLRDRLRIGYVCGEFYFNASYFFVAPFLLHHDENRCEPVLYNTSNRVDECTAELREAVPAYHEVAGRGKADLASQFRSDEIDILVDLSGHFANNVLSAFRMRPAPVQVTYLNYPATTGLSEMDYLITDGWLDPPGATESHYSEQLWRLNRGSITYHPLETSPAVSPSPAARNGFVTFGLFQRPAKMNARVWDVIAGTLRRLPAARLVIHFLSHDLEDPLSALRLRIAGELSRRGVNASNLIWASGTSQREHMSLVGSVDIAFDTFPYNGQTTTCECLWMGVPTVSLSGHTRVSRVTGSLLQQVGLSDWVAPTPADYVDIAVSKAEDIDCLASLRSELRQRMAASPLTDGQGLAASLAEAYSQMWGVFTKAS